MSKQPGIILFVAIGISLVPPSPAVGADPAVIQRPLQTHRFFDRQNITVLTVHAIVMTADVVSTRRALQVPGTYEGNPLMRSQTTSIALKAASVGAGLGVAYMLHKSGHHKAERMVPALFGIPSAVAAVHNAGIRP